MSEHAQPDRDRARELGLLRRVPPGQFVPEGARAAPVDHGQHRRAPRAPHERAHPNYKLQKVHDENPEFQVVTKVTMKDTWKLINLALWDEERRRLIRFRDLKKRSLAA